MAGGAEALFPLGRNAGADLVLHGPSAKCGTKMLLREAPASPEVRTAEEQVASGRFCLRKPFPGKEHQIQRGMFESGRFWGGICDSSGLLAGWRECAK